MNRFSSLGWTRQTSSDACHALRPPMFARLAHGLLYQTAAASTTTRVASIFSGFELDNGVPSIRVLHRTVGTPFAFTGTRLSRCIA
ncbi:hypothetical protein SAMN05445504_5494 [Burkholderia sp. CF099]|nr:hypothetical protein SAMN05445504_5494 [Burkholderia sp. CF099]